MSDGRFPFGRLVNVARTARKTKQRMASPASADGWQRKQALVIGINKYPGDNSLKYCINDAEDLTATLRRMGFHVLLKLDCTRTEFLQTIERFGQCIQRNDLVLFYFAGHGKQSEGENYLLPSDYDYDHSTTEAKYIPNHAIHAYYITKKLGDASGTGVLLLDCCRNFVRTRATNMQQGLAFMNVTSKTLCVFSCAPGKATLDETRNGRNSIFLGCFLKRIEASNEDIETVLMNVAADVEWQSGGFQLPYRTSCLTKKLYLKAQAGT